MITKSRIIYKRFTALTVCTLLFINMAMSQREIVMSQYMYNKYSINPAFAGSHECLSLFASFRKQWLGFDNSPTGGIASLHSPLNNEHMALGGLVYSEGYGVTRNTGFNVSYAYRTYLNKDTKLSFGLSGGIFMQNSNWADVPTIDPEDPSFGYSDQLSTPWVGFGTAIYNSNYFVGFSIPSLLYTDIYSSNENKLDFGKIDYLLTAGYFYHLNDNITLNPATLIRVNPDQTSFVDISATAIINNTIIGGFTYRTTKEIVGIIGYEISPQLRVTYSLDYRLNELASYNNGTHEIGLQFNFGYEINTPNPKFF